MKWIGISLFAAMCFGGPTQAQTYCPYEAYTPSNLQLAIKGALTQWGMGLVPASLRSGQDDERGYIIRGRRVVAGWNFQDDVKSGTATLTITDEGGRMLLFAQERVAPCSKLGKRGMCEKTTIRTAIGAGTERFGSDVPQFEAQWTPVGLYLYQFGQKENPVVWRGDVHEALRWTVNVLKTARGRAVPLPRKTVTGFYNALLTDPLVYPYLHRITLIPARGDTVKVVGRVPSNFVYSRIVDAALRVGLYPNMDVIIDTRLRRPHLLGTSAITCLLDLY